MTSSTAIVHCKYSNQIYIETKTVNTKNRDDKTQNIAQKALEYVSKTAPSHMSTSFTGLMMCIVKCYIFDFFIFQKKFYSISFKNQVGHFDHERVK